MTTYKTHNKRNHINKLSDSALQAQVNELSARLDKLTGGVKKAQEVKPTSDCSVQAAVIHAAHTPSYLASLYNTKEFTRTFQRYVSVNTAIGANQFDTLNSANVPEGLIDTPLPIFNSMNNTVQLNNPVTRDVTLSGIVGLRYSDVKSSFTSLDNGVTISHAEALNAAGVCEIGLKLKSSFLSRGYLSTIQEIDECEGEIRGPTETEESENKANNCCGGFKRNQICTSGVDSKARTPDCIGTLLRHTETSCQRNSINYIPLTNFIRSEKIDERFRVYHRRDAYAVKITDAAIIYGQDPCLNRIEAMLVVEVRQRLLPAPGGFVFHTGATVNYTAQDIGEDQLFAGVRPDPNDIPDSELAIPPEGEAGEALGVVPFGLANEFFSDPAIWNEINSVTPTVLSARSPLSVCNKQFLEYLGRMNSLAHLKLYKRIASVKDCVGHTQMLSVKEVEECKDCSSLSYSEPTFMIESVKGNGINHGEDHELGIVVGSVVKVDMNRVVSDIHKNLYAPIYNPQHLDDKLGTFQITQQVNSQDSKLGDHFKSGDYGKSLHDFNCKPTPVYIPIHTPGSDAKVSFISLCGKDPLPVINKNKKKTKLNPPATLEDEDEDEDET
jgi:hypothetical protein